jgi:hypothetical protein
MTERILRVRPSIAESVSRHLLTSRTVAEHMLKEAWGVVERVGEALLEPGITRLAEDTVACLVSMEDTTALRRKWSQDVAELVQARPTAKP